MGIEPRRPGARLRAVAWAWLATAVAPAAAAETEIRLTIASAYPPVTLIVRSIRQAFIPAVDRRLLEAGGDYRIRWVAAWSGTLARTADTLEAAELGVVDIGHVNTMFEGSKLPLQNVAYYAPFGSDDPRLACAVIYELHEAVPEAAEAWRRLDLEFLINYPLDSNQLFTSFAVRSLDDLRGRKIAAGGPNLAWLRGTGAVGVVASGATVYNDMKAGLFEGVVTAGSFGVETRLYEVASHATLVDFGAMSVGALVVNGRRWRAMPEEVREALRAASREFLEYYLVNLEHDSRQVTDTLRARGMQVTRLSAAERERWARSLPNIAATWASEPARRRALQWYMRTMRERGVVFPRDWDLE
jgi:TRAP-type C4-dicarboxylate transport system substrate-binding protein